MGNSFKTKVKPEEKIVSELSKKKSKKSKKKSKKLTEESKKLTEEQKKLKKEQKELKRKIELEKKESNILEVLERTEKNETGEGEGEGEEICKDSSNQTQKDLGFKIPLPSLETSKRLSNTETYFNRVVNQKNILLVVIIVAGFKTLFYLVYSGITIAIIVIRILCYVNDECVSDKEFSLLLLTYFNGGQTFIFTFLDVVQIIISNEFIRKLAGKCCYDSCCKSCSCSNAKISESEEEWEPLSCCCCFFPCFLFKLVKKMYTDKRKSELPKRSGELQKQYQQGE